MYYTLKEASAQVGLGRRTIQTLEEEGVTRKPRTKNKMGHLLYSEAEVKRLWLARFFREMGCSNKEIGKILNDPQLDVDAMVTEKIAQLETQASTLLKMAGFAKKMQELGGEEPMRKVLPDLPQMFAAVPYDITVTVAGMADEPGEEYDIRPFLNPDFVYPGEAWYEELMEAELALEECSDEGMPAGAEDPQLVTRHLLELLEPYLGKTVFMYSALQFFLMPGSGIWELTEVFEKSYARYYGKALSICCSRMLNNPRLPESRFVTRMCALSGKSDPGSREAQAAVGLIHEQFKTIRWLNPAGHTEALRLIGKAYLLPEFQRSIDRMMNVGTALFVSDAIRIYCQRQQAAQKL